MITFYIHKNANFTFSVEWNHLEHRNTIHFNGLEMKFGKFDYCPVNINEEEWIRLN